VLINRSKVKEFALEMAKHRAHKFTRGGGDFFIRCEGGGIHPQLRSPPALQR